MNKKILSAAVAMALAAGISGTAMAAEGSLADVPKDHYSTAKLPADPPITTALYSAMVIFCD